jgi:hypothetical protein
LNFVKDVKIFVDYTTHGLKMAIDPQLLAIDPQIVALNPHRTAENKTAFKTHDLLIFHK